MPKYSIIGIHTKQGGTGMNKIRIMDVEGTEFPSGRITRVLLGENGAINGDHFCQGYVIVYPGGTVPVHSHTMVES